MKKIKKSQPILFAHRLYLLVRNDLPSMNAGRAMAQAAHAANQLVFENPGNSHIKNWQADRGFGTTICLAANRETIVEIVNKAKINSDLAGLTYDPTYKYVLHREIAELIDVSTMTAPVISKEDGQYVLFRNELTCGYVFLVEGSSDAEELVGALPLHP